MCLQYTDFSRTAIGSFVSVLSDGNLKREVSLRHPFSLLGQQNEELQTDRQTDRHRQVGMKRTKEFLADHYLTHRQGKAISTATNSYFSPAPAFYHSKFYLQLMSKRYGGSWGLEKRLPQIHSRDHTRFYIHIWTTAVHPTLLAVYFSVLFAFDVSIKGKKSLVHQQKQ